MNFDFEPIQEVDYDDSEKSEELENHSQDEDNVLSEDDFVDISSTSYIGDEEEFDLMGMGNKKKKKNKVRMFVNIFVSILLVISLTVTGLGIFYANIYDKPITKTEEEFTSIFASKSKDVSYFLVVGCDWTGSKQTDVIIVVCIDHQNKKANLLQIPRDTYINTGGKINSAYALAPENKKIMALCQVLNNELGIPIDHYILFSMEAAAKVVDEIGGVEMKLNSKIQIEDPFDLGEYYDLIPDENGKVLLSGKDAVGFMRKRKGTEEGYETGSDIGRIKQQRKFYSALFKKLLKMSKLEIADVASECMTGGDDSIKVETSLTIDEAISYAIAVQEMTSKDIKVYGMPGQSAWYNGGSYYSYHKDEYIEMFNEHFNPYGETLTAEDISMTELHNVVGSGYSQWLTNEGEELEQY